MPLCIAQNKEILGIVPLVDTDDLPDAQRNAELFLKVHPHAKVLIVSVMDQDQVLTPRVRWVGVGRLLG